MPQQQTKPFGIFETSAVIGFAVVMDLFQAIGIWAFTIIIGVVGPANFLDSTTARVVGAIVSALTVKTLDFAVGLVVGAVFSVFMAVATGIILALWFGFKKEKVPFMVPLAAATPFEMVPFLNMLPLWTLSTIYVVFSANGWLGVLVDVGLAVFTGGTSVAVEVAGKEALGTAAKAGAKAYAARSDAKNTTREDEEGTPQKTRSNPLPMNDIRKAGAKMLSKAA